MTFKSVYILSLKKKKKKKFVPAEVGISWAVCVRILGMAYKWNVWLSVVKGYFFLFYKASIILVQCKSSQVAGL